MSPKRLNWSYGDDYFSKKTSVIEKVFQESPSKTQSQVDGIIDQSYFDTLDVNNIEYYENICNSLIIPINGYTEVPHLISFTCCKSGEGVSTIVSNLAAVLANHADDRVLFVDTNFEKPSAHQFFGVNLAPGLGEILMDGYESSAAIQPSPMNNLFILTTGGVHSDPTPKFDSPMFSELLKKWKLEYRYVLFDTPPMKCYGKYCEINSSVRIANLVEGVILIIEAENTRREVVQRVKERLVQSKANILGVVLNKKKFYIPRWLYKTL